MVNRPNQEKMGHKALILIERFIFKIGDRPAECKAVLSGEFET
jgi:hypothetical protein